jgi:hypothetical protein
MIRRVRSVTVILGFTLLGCASVNLINANQEFTSLMQQAAQAERLLNDHTFDQASYESAMEGLQLAFANNGDVAVKAAAAATTDQSKASLLNVAARSYLKSGPVAETKIPAIADEGLATCSRLSGLDALPTTCGYFHIVVPQAINEDWARQVDAIKAREPMFAGQQPLSVADGKLLVRATEAFFAQLDALSSVENKLDLASAGEGLTKVFYNQQNIFFCNAQSALISLRLVVEAADGWNRAAEESRLRSNESTHLAELRSRPVGFERCP